MKSTSKSTTQFSPLPKSPRNHPYEFVSSRLRYEVPLILVRDGDKTKCIDLSQLVLPATIGHPHPLRMFEDPGYLNLSLALADRYAALAKAPTGLCRKITRQLYLLRNVLDWLRGHGIYRLADASQQHFQVMLQEYANSGWVSTLQLASRWHHALDSISADELKEGFYYYKANGGIYHIDSLVAPFWRHRLGWGGIVQLPPEIKERIELLAPAPFSKDWTMRKEPHGIPLSSSVRNTLTHINDWTNLPDSVDRPRFRVADNVDAHVKSLSSKMPTRTRNLALDKAIEIIVAAFQMQYEAAPQLIALLELARTENKNGRKELPATWLSQQLPIVSLEKLLGKPVVRWVVSGHHAKKPDVYTVEQIVGAVQSACAIVLAMMNARRQREICDGELGVRVGDLNIIDDDLGIYQSKFYIEKTYFDRHEFYINRTSADALRCLYAIKEASLPVGGAIADCSSLFSCHRRTELGVQRELHLDFSGDPKRARSLASFFEVALGRSMTPEDATAHMMRRFYAILYFHRYDHAELRALRQHLRHMEVAMTRIYVTDPSTRAVSEDIQTKMGQTRFNVADRRLRSALDYIQDDFDDMLTEAGKEKLHQAVTQIIEGEPTGGGFSRIVSKLFRQFLQRVLFVPSNTVGITKNISDKLWGHGYRVIPMSHGQCHAPEEKRHLKAKCEVNGVLARENAGPQVCHSCPYHFNNQNYLQNILDDLTTLESESRDEKIPPLLRQKAEFDLANLRELISSLEVEMQKNSHSNMGLERRQL